MYEQKLEGLYGIFYVELIKKYLYIMIKSIVFSNIFLKNAKITSSSKNKKFRIKEGWKYRLHKYASKNKNRNNDRNSGDNK
jgi:hypothetical protein